MRLVGLSKGLKVLAKIIHILRIIIVSGEYCMFHSQKDYESEAEFRKTTQPGDILLFRGKKDTSVMQRAVTMDEFGTNPYI